MVYWQANQQYIAQNLCENRNNPDSDCGGSCHLEKQLDNADENKAPFTPHKGIEKIEIPAFDMAGQLQWQPLETNNTALYNIAEELFLPYDFTFSVFHPPEAKV